jgi:hypothetical protein
MIKNFFMYFLTIATKNYVQEKTKKSPKKIIYANFFFFKFFCEFINKIKKQNDKNKNIHPIISMKVILKRFDYNF